MSRTAASRVGPRHSSKTSGPDTVILDTLLRREEIHATAVAEGVARISEMFCEVFLLIETISSLSCHLAILSFFFLATTFLLDLGDSFLGTFVSPATTFLLDLRYILLEASVRP